MTYFVANKNGKKIDADLAFRAMNKQLQYQLEWDISEKEMPSFLDQESFNQKFFDIYSKAHKEKFNEDFLINV